VFLELKDEITELCGSKIYSRIVEALRTRTGSALPHPKARKKSG
jgi:hypothetical protein